MKHSNPSLDPRNPEGVLFRTVFGEPQHAEGLLRGFLPPDVVAAIDWSSLQRVDRSLVDEALSHLQADVLFSARIGGRQGFLYLLLERASGATVYNLGVAAVGPVQEAWLLENVGLP